MIDIKPKDMHARYSPTYRGVKIPGDLRADGVPYRVFEAWKRGVDSELDGVDPFESEPGGLPASEPADPFAPDLSMSPEVADFILRAVNGLLLEGYWPKVYTVDGRHGGEDTEDHDDDLIRRAADIVGRDKIQNRDLRRHIAELDEDDGSTT
jgi:hypothetical protein